MRQPLVSLWIASASEMCLLPNPCSPPCPKKPKNRRIGTRTYVNCTPRISAMALKAYDYAMSRKEKKVDA